MPRHEIATSPSDRLPRVVPGLECLQAMRPCRCVLANLFCALCLWNRITNQKARRKPRLGCRRLTHSNVVQQVLAKPSGLDLGFQVAIGGGDDASASLSERGN